MSSQFNTYQLGEVAEIIAGGDKPKVFSLDKKASVRVPVLANAEKNNGLMGFTDNARIFEPAVTVAARGSNVGFVAVRKEPFFPVVRLLSLIPKKDRLNVDYLFYNLKQNRKTGTGSGQPQITIPDISSKTISLPPISVQQKVAEVLSVLDQKIELNNRINAELEAMAKTLYDYWFVQFDFPDDSPQGQPYKTSGGKMVYNPTLKREIPAGWEDSTIGEIEPNIVTGKTPSKDSSEYFGGNVPFITIGDIRGNTYIVSTEETLTASGAATQKNKFLPEDSICVTCIASPGLVGFVTTPAQTNQQINSVVCSNEINKYYLYFAIKGYFEGAKAKTGNTFSNMNKGDFSAIVILKPSDQALRDYHQKAYPLFEKIKLKSLENKQLVELRDWLLPMLMNGQVTVK
ncbi:restriction endonuclease subunit S [Shewanella phaeophyticola]|uniref:Restriction endonuclease subunit S n=1 Tax=Shewanella phaeophyticola TaxID=2978345 RepID=A0ABT2P6J8_9GAMM|nr:restriction endonuclease subunit S [Shewanella sp. KJ10-1]MCT8988287.1 restriction endonuclease subunit S [Shewanella sp. KJ10-1]